MQATLKIFNAIKRLEIKNGRTYTEKQIAELSRLHRHTVSALMEGRVDTTASKLLTFFKEEGMEITIDDLYDVSADESPSDLPDIPHIETRQS